MTFVISSPSFSNGGKIPTKFTCDGTDVSPELIWIAQPPGTQSFTLIADDPDAPVGTWTHWVFFNLPAHTTALPEGVTKVDEARVATTSGKSVMAAPVRLSANPTATSLNPRFAPTIRVSNAACREVFELPETALRTGVHAGSLFRPVRACRRRRDLVCTPKSKDR